MYEGKFLKGTNYKKAFQAEVSKLVEIEMPVQWRIKAIEELTEAYFKQTGELPESEELNRLADFILKDDLTDKHPDKVTNAEYPILSEGQVKLRLKREKATDLTNFTHDKKHKMNGRKAANYVRESK